MSRSRLRSRTSAAFISGRIPLPGDPDAAFSAALAEYSEFHVPQPPSLAALQELRDLIATALARTFGGNGRAGQAPPSSASSSSRTMLSAS